MTKINASSVSLILIALLAGCKSSQPSLNREQPTPLTVEAMNIERLSKYEVTREYVGQVRLSQRAALGFELPGKITRIYVDAGDSIARGEPLVQLDTQFLDTERLELLAQKDEVVAQRALVDTNLNRQKLLKTKGFSADAEIDNLNSQTLVLQAKLARIDAALANIALKREKSTIYAPYEGVIGERVVSIGDVVSAGTPTVTLLSNEEQEVVIGVPLTLLPLAKNNPITPIKIGTQSIEATLINAAPSIDLRSRTVSLRYQLPNNIGVREKEIAYLRLPEQVAQPGAWVPVSALISGVQGVWNVLVINPEQKVERRAVTVHFTDAQHAYVEGELADGEAVISSGLHRIVAGQKVATKQSSTPIAKGLNPNRSVANDEIANSEPTNDDLINARQLETKEGSHELL